MAGAGEGAGGGAQVWCWTFGTAEFDEARWQLRVAGRVVELERRPLEVLQYLLRHAGEAVTREELLEAGWAGRVVVEAVLTNAIGKLRRALADEGQEIIVTLPKVGYRFGVAVSRKRVEFLPSSSRLTAGDAVPRRTNWRLETALARTEGSEVWIARHAKTREVRVFKFSLAGSGLAALKREVAIARLLQEALGDRHDYVRVRDWDFEEAPYFIESDYGGASLDRWPGEGRAIAGIPLETRLSLFAQAVEAVAAAHGVGVLHKDLKPANLLVREEGDAIRVRVADFGSSRLLDSGRLDALGITRFGLTHTQATPDSGTPLYLAPEVVLGHPATIRSDVYALGVTLYQLLVGDFRRPLSPGWENDIPDPLLRKDIADAAHGDPASRLDSASLLAERIRTLDARRRKRALELSVQARIEQGERRLARARARRPWVIAATLLLAAGLGATAWQWQRSLAAERLAAEQRDAAEKQARRAEAVVQYLSHDLIRSITPEGKGFEQDPTIREMVAYASSTVDGNFGDDPATLGSLHAALGASWASLFDTQRSIEHYRKAAQGYAQVFGEADELTLLTRYDLARQLAGASAFEEAHRVLAAADGLAGDRLRSDGRLALWSAWSTGVLLDRELKPDEAEPMLRRAETLQARLAPERHAMAASIRLGLADIWQRQGKFTEVIALLRQWLADPHLASEETRNSYRSTLAKILILQNRNDATRAEALALATQAAESTARMQGDEAQATLLRRAEVARVHSRSGNCEAALEIYRQVWETGVRRFGPENPHNLLNGSLLADREFNCGDPRRGAEVEALVVATNERLRPDDPMTHASYYTAAIHRVEEGRFDEALELLGRIDAGKMAAATSSPSAGYWIEVQRGRCLIGLGDGARGRRLIASALDGMVGMGIDPQARGLVKARSYLAE